MDGLQRYAKKMSLLRRIFGRNESSPTEPTSEALLDTLEGRFGNLISSLGKAGAVSHRSLVRGEFAAFCLWAVRWALRRDGIAEDSVTFINGLSILSIRASRVAPVSLFSDLDDEALFAQRANFFDRLNGTGLVDTNQVNPVVFRAVAKLASISAGAYRMSDLSSHTTIVELDYDADLSNIEDKETQEAHVAQSAHNVIYSLLPSVMEILWELDARVQANSQA